jgi:hypothetical protein
MRRMLWLLGVVLAVLTTTRGARAWDGTGMWYDSAVGAPASIGGVVAGPGGGGLLATGGLRDYNVTCANCHIKAQGLIDVTLTFDGAPPPAAYTPGHTYQMVGTLVGEHLGLSGCGQYTPNNNNNFTARAEDASGNLAGALSADYGSTASCPSGPPPQTFGGGTMTFGDCHAVLTTGPSLTSWSFQWTAPAAGTGGVTFYFAAVDGNCMMDSLGDDVKVANLTLGEGMAMRALRRDANTMLAWLGVTPVLGLVGAVRRRTARSK